MAAEPSGNTTVGTVWLPPLTFITRSAAAGSSSILKSDSVAFTSVGAPLADGASAGRLARHAGARVLGVEDNEINRFLLRRYLEAAGHRVTEAVDGVDGVFRCRASVLMEKGFSMKQIFSSSTPCSPITSAV